MNPQPVIPPTETPTKPRWIWVGTILAIILYVGLIGGFFWGTLTTPGYNFQAEMLLETTPKYPFDGAVKEWGEIQLNTLDAYNLPSLASQFPLVRMFIYTVLTALTGASALTFTKAASAFALVLGAMGMFLLLRSILPTANHPKQTWTLAWFGGMFYVLLPLPLFSMAYAHVGLQLAYGFLPLLLWLYRNIWIAQNENRPYLVQSTLFGILFAFMLLNQPQQAVFSVVAFLLFVVVQSLFDGSAKHINTTWFLKRIASHAAMFIPFVLGVGWYVCGVSAYSGAQLPPPGASMEALLPWTTNAWRVAAFGLYALGTTFGLEYVHTVFIYLPVLSCLLLFYPLFRQDMEHSTSRSFFSFALLGYFLSIGLAFGLQRQVAFTDTWTYWVLLAGVLALAAGLLMRARGSAFVFVVLFGAFLLSLQPAIYPFLYDHVPFFASFRTPHRFMYMVCMFGTVLFVGFFAFWSERFMALAQHWRAKIVVWIFVCMCSGYAAWGLWHAAGALAPLTLTTSQTQAYEDVADFIAKDPSDFRVIVLPTWPDAEHDIYVEWFRYSPVLFMGPVHWMREYLLVRGVRLADTLTTNLMPADSAMVWNRLDRAAGKGSWTEFANLAENDWSIKYVVIPKHYVTLSNLGRLRFSGRFTVVKQNALFLVAKVNYSQEGVITANPLVRIDSPAPKTENAVEQTRRIDADRWEVTLKNTKPVAIFLATPALAGWQVRTDSNTAIPMERINGGMGMMATLNQPLKSNTVYIEFVGTPLYRLAAWWLEFVPFLWGLALIIAFAIDRKIGKNTQKRRQKLALENNTIVYQP